MTGAAIIGALLRADPDVTARVPATDIKGGKLPEGQALPALLVRTTSIIDRHTLKRQGWERRTARVSVTVRAASYRDQGEIIELARRCCAGREGDIAGGWNVSVLTAGVGPDVIGPGNSFEQTQDFRVGFDVEV